MYRWRLVARVTTAVVATAAVIVMSGCTSHSADPGGVAPTGVSVTPPEYYGGTLTYAQMNVEYRDETGKLTPLPAGIRWPSEVPDHTPATDPEPMVYQNGAGRVEAQKFWSCAWAREFVRAVNTGDSAATAVAAANFEKVRDMPFRKYFADGAAGAFADRAIDAVKLGDPGPVSQYAQGAFCGWFMKEIVKQSSASPAPGHS